MPDRVGRTNFARLYERLKAMAGRQCRRLDAAVSLSATEVVHELFVRLCAARQPLCFAADPAFFAYAAKAMRHVVVDAARRSARQVRGGDQCRIDLTDPVVAALSQEASSPTLKPELDAALTALHSQAPRAARVLELHVFDGLSLARVAALTGRSSRTVDRDWRYARTFLAGRVAA